MWSLFLFVSPSALANRRPTSNSLLTLYQRIHEAIHLRPTTSASGGAARPPAKLVYLRTEHEAVLGWVSCTLSSTIFSFSILRCS